MIGHVPGLGLMIGIEIVRPNEAQDHMGCYPADGELSALPAEWHAPKRPDPRAWLSSMRGVAPAAVPADQRRGLDVFLDKFEQALLAAGVNRIQSE
ncbi:hypothetical protein LNP74_31590 [Klebsiella pneumoniae subsp. pneumoniae]|nr:hypothetical protein [Klebsiella pneumoniae subsp. pneumoniae]